MGKIQNTHLIGCVLFLKVMSDMFYQIQVLDILLLAVLGLNLVYMVFTQKLRFCVCDVLIALMGVLFTVSFLKDMAYYRDYVKLISAFMLYFWGRYHYRTADAVSQTLLWAYFIAFLVNIVCCITGNGTVVWGSAVTYRGMYYFKTDFTAMIAFFTVFYFVKDRKFTAIDYVLLVLAGVFTVLANTRIYYMIYSVLLCCVWLYKRNDKLLTWKSITWIVVFAMIGVLSVVILPRLPFFADRQMISLEADNMTSNLQGRNNIWGPLFQTFGEQNLLTQLFGAGLSFNDTYGLAGFDEHSLYVKTILNTGYVGMLLWVAFLILIVYYLGKEKNRRTSFQCAMLIGIYSVAGISACTNLFTSTSWFPLLYCGMICGIEKSSGFPESVGNHEAE